MKKVKSYVLYYDKELSTGRRRLFKWRVESKYQAQKMLKKMKIPAGYYDDGSGNPNTKIYSL